MENHKRRIHYSGTHPKKYEEKYKEHHPEEYQETIEKVIKKGNTPAGMHLSIMTDEVLRALSIKENEIGFDATLGYGGHSLLMLKELHHTGHLYASDLDPIEIEKTTKRLNEAGYEEFFTAINMNFKDLDTILKDEEKFDFVLADLGVSSMQIDNPERGFSFKHNGPLDLRFDPTKGIPASYHLMSMDSDELEGMLRENSDEPYAKEIAKAMREKMVKEGPLKTTKELESLVIKVLKGLKIADTDSLYKKTLQRVFQAIRIDLNSEFESLYDFLEKLPYVLNKGGRVAILTFHSGEDRLVKKAFKEGFREGYYSFISDIIRPGIEELRTNPRSKSTKLRYAIKA